MTMNIEEHLPIVKQEGLNTDKAVDLDSTLNVEGAVTLQSTLAVTGAVTQTGDISFVGATNGLKRTAEIQLTGTGDTLLAGESGKTMIATKASLTQTFVLPSAATAGLFFTFICGSAAGEILIDPAGSENIICKATNDAGASVAPAGGTGIKNTAASNVLNDYITLVADGVDTWYTVAQSGIFASQ